MARKIWGRGWWTKVRLQWLNYPDDLEEKEPAIFDEASESFTIGEAPTATTTRTGGASSAKRDPAMSIIKKVGLAISNDSGSSDYQMPEYNFEDITNSYNAEGFVRQALDKYIEMMFKAGWDLVGKNPNATDYLKMRFRLMAEATSIPTEQLFAEIAEDVVKYSNAVIAKARAKDMNIFQGLNVMGVGDNAPVAGYFPLNLQTLSIKRDKFGIVKGWQQEVDGQQGTVKFKPQDIVHIYYKREKGRAFGTPFLTPALDDIRALREIEENVLRLVYRNLHPLWHMKVGLPDPGLQAEPGEVEEVRAEVENMAVEGGLVTNERVSIQAVASNQIIDAYNYLKHFEDRVFSVMGVSALMMGRGGSANRSTGDNISGEFVDRCKAFQRVVSVFIDENMIKELLMEGGFDPVLNPDDAVRFVFREIDKDSQIKAENQAVYLYEHNAITEDEMRELLGRDPVEDGEQRARMHLQVITVATLEAEAALATTTTTAGTGSAAAGQEKKKAATDNKNKPTNQHGTKTSPKKTTNQSELLYKKDLFAEYATLNEVSGQVIKRYYETLDNKYVDQLNRIFDRADDQFLSITKNHLDEASAIQARTAITRMTSSMRERMTYDMQKMVGNEAFDQMKEVKTAIFDVFTDRLEDIASKTYNLYESTKEVDDDGESSQDIA